MYRAATATSRTAALTARISSAATTTHFHSLVRVPNEGFSAAFQHLTGRYATYYNHRYQRTGPVFDGRFRSVLIESDEQLIPAARYIHRNPLSVVPLPALASYRWSSYPASLGRADPPDWLVTDESLLLVAMDPRLLAISLLVEQRQLGVDEIARQFGLATPSAVRNAARRARILEAADPVFAALRWRATGRRDVGASGRRGVGA